MNKTKKTIILDGLEEPITSESQTTRTIERNQEDEDYVPVILKRKGLLTPSVITTEP